MQQKIWGLIGILVFGLFGLPGCGGSEVTCSRLAGCVGLAWDPSMKVNPQTGEKTPLTDVGYRVHWGNSSGSYPNDLDVGAVTTYRVRNLPVGVYYFVVSAYRLNNISERSGYSNEVHTPVQGLNTLTVGKEMRVVVGLQ